MDYFFSNFMQLISKNYFTIDFDSFLTIPIINGLNLNGEFKYKEKYWNKITIYINFGDSKINANYNIEVNGEKKLLGKLAIQNYLILKLIMIETKNDTYIDDLIIQTDYKIPNYFRDIFNIFIHKTIK